MATHVVILAGGAGTRFWPSGRRARPKQLLKISGPRSLLAETLARCEPLAAPTETWIVTADLQLEGVRREAPDLPDAQLIAEPSMRNTAAAIGLAAVRIRARDPEGVMVVMPADHAIEPPDVFVSTFRAAVARAASEDVLITVGIRPTGPATGYGYIEGGDAVAEVEGHTVHRVRSFKEKPDAATAAAFLATGNYFWNSGMFVWRAETLLRAMREHLPGHAEVLEDIATSEGLSPDSYARFENIPIDVGVMERADNVEVFPATFLWDDVGSWLALDRLHERDDNGNTVLADHVGIDTENCIVVGKDGHIVATLGVSDLIVVHTKDATMVCRKDRAEDVREIAKRLKQLGLEDYT
ncbi:MAG: mannose-1-phosphate guanylyltransferase [Planctomycetota bacterium]|jgi:mannose-1-phosphate guanylyltransferase